MCKLSVFLPLIVACVFGANFQSIAQNETPLPNGGAQSGKTPHTKPAITHISPGTGVTGASVMVSGQSFGATQGSSTISFDGTPASVVLWNNWTILANVPGGAKTGNVVVNIGGSPTNGVNFNVITIPTRSLTASNFGFECSLVIGDCGARDLKLVWPQVPAPGSLRLHDVYTSWSDLSTGPGTFDWTWLDTWLDMIAQHRPLQVIEVFSWVPCWNASSCEAPPIAPTGTNTPPLDLTASGSPAFNEFVTGFVQHCSAAGNCVGNCPPGKACASTNLITLYEMWNEWNTTVRWSGSAAQLYQMLAPAVSIIRANVNNAVILTPSTTTGNKSVFSSWLNLETSNGRISDWVVWHDYLVGNTPEYEWGIQSAIYLSNQISLPAWKSMPWADTETGFNPQNYTCPAKFNAQDCAGQVLRWNLLHLSNGAQSLSWYRWNQIIGSKSQYETPYESMMQYLKGGKFAGPCSSSVGQTPAIWTCSFTESNSKTALWVWTPSESGAEFTVPSGYVDYLDMSGGNTTVYGGQSISVSTMPVMLEQ